MAANWYVGSVIADPTIGQVLVVSPMLPAGSTAITSYVYSTVSCSTAVQRLRGGLLRESVTVAGSTVWWPAPVPLVMVAGDVVQVVANETVVGSIQVVLFLSSL